MKKTLSTLALTGLFLAPLANAVPITINFNYSDPAGVSAVANLTATSLGGGNYLATSGTLTLSGGTGLLNGSYSLVPGGPTVFYPPGFQVDNVIYPASDPILDSLGLIGFKAGSTYLNIWGNAPGNYSLYTYNTDSGGYSYAYTFDVGGQTGNSLTVKVPDGGATLGLLGVALVGMGWARRKLA